MVLVQMDLIERGTIKKVSINGDMIKWATTAMDTIRMALTGMVSILAVIVQKDIIGMDITSMATIKKDTMLRGTTNTDSIEKDMM